MEGKRVLIVEDESIPAMELRQEVEGMGCLVVGTAMTGEDAIKAATETRPDVVLMDVRLKGEVDGIEAAKRIQMEMDIPIIYLSAYSDEGTMERASKTKLYWFLQKPYAFDIIRSTIEEAVNNPSV